MKTKKTMTDAKVNVKEVLARDAERDKLLEGPDVLLGREQAAIVLQMSLNWLDQLLGRGMIPSSMHESRRVFSRDRLVQFLDSIEDTTREERQAEGFARRSRELKLADVLHESAALYERQVQVMKQGLAGQPVDKYAMNEITDKLMESEAAEEQMLVAIDTDAGVLGFFHHVVPAKKGVRMEKICTGYREVDNGLGCLTRTPIYITRPMDLSKQVVIDDVQAIGAARRR